MANRRTKGYNNDLQNTPKKTTDLATRTSLKLEQTVPAPYVAPVIAIVSTISNHVQIGIFYLSTC